MSIVMPDIVEGEKCKATNKLLAELAEGEKPGHEEGWTTFGQMTVVLGIDNV